MAQTWAQHLTDLETQYPDTPLQWHLHVDNADHAHDDRAVAQAVGTIAGETYEYEVRTLGTTAVYALWLSHVESGEDAPRRNTDIGDSWASIKAFAEARWVRQQASVRNILTTERHAKEVMAETGLLYPPGKESRVATMTATPRDGSNVLTDFDSNHFSYAVSTSALSVSFDITLLEDTSTVAWSWSAGARIGSGARFGVPIADSPVGKVGDVSLTVTSQDGTATSSYTIGITKTAADDSSE